MCQNYFSVVTASNLDAVIQINLDNPASFQNHVKISKSPPRLEPGTSRSLSECAMLYTNETSL